MHVCTEPRHPGAQRSDGLCTGTPVLINSQKGSYLHGWEDSEELRVLEFYQNIPETCPIEDS